MTVKWSFRIGAFSLGMVAVGFCPLDFEAVILLDVRVGHCFPRFKMECPASTNKILIDCIPERSGADFFDTVRNQSDGGYERSSELKVKRRTHGFC
ncbi:hypothetical protein Peur_019798 [Populus x canadensis]